MLISIEVRLVYSAEQPCNLLLQIEANEGPLQTCENTKLSVEPDVAWSVVTGEEGLGKRRWGIVEGLFDCTYQTQVHVTRPAVVLEGLEPTPFAAIPDDVTKFLMPSRYCHPEDFLEFVPKQFGKLRGGNLIAAMSAWINENFTYDSSASHGATNASHSFAERAGVCRDYAHVLIAMARSVGIPARIVSCYAPDVSPQDFHAVAEVFLNDTWHLVDATGMAEAPEIVRIGVGRDAADVSFMTSYGWMALKKQSVRMTRAS